MKRYTYFISGGAHRLFPTESFFGNLMWSEDDGISVPYCCPFADEWGKPVSMHVYEKKEFPIPSFLDMIWLSLTENKFYSIEEKLPTEDLEKSFQESDEATGDSLYYYMIVGMAPYGRIALWLHGNKKAKLVAWMEAEETDVDMEDFCPSTRLTRDEYVNMMLNSVPEAKENLEKNGLPPRDLFDRYMQQFTYRYVVQFGHWDEENKEWKEYEDDEVRPEFDYIEEALFDGTHDKLHDGGLMEYHQAGKPKKLALQWHIKKSDYSAYLWFDDMKIRDYFERFYIQNPDAKMDFSIHIDPEKNKYQIALTCAASEEPIIVEEDAYQIIVFKSKFECFRSMNYNQPRGAWIW